MGAVTGTPAATGPSGPPGPPGAGPAELGSQDRWPARLGARLGRSLAWLDLLGDQLSFYAQALAWTPRAVRRYYRQILRLLPGLLAGQGVPRGAVGWDLRPIFGFVPVAV